MKLARLLVLLAFAPGIAGCYFSQNCPLDLAEAESHDKQACIADIREEENLNDLLLLSIITGGFPGSQLDTAEESDNEGENGGSGVGGD